MEERKEGKKRFSVSRDREVSEVVIVFAESAEEACEKASEAHWTEWKPVDSYIDNYEAEEVA